jgi:uncharacterized protein (DUF58 family)
MATHTARLSKQRYACILAAALTHLALTQHDAVGLTLFAGQVLEHLKPRAKANQLEEILSALVHTPMQPHGESAQVLHEVAELMPRRGLVVLISDLFYETAELFAALDHFRFQGHEVLIFHVLDPLERRLPAEGSIRFHDLETDEELVTQAQDLQPAYDQAITNWFAELAQGCRTRDIERVVLTSDEPLDRALAEYLGKRAQEY